MDIRKFLKRKNPLTPEGPSSQPPVAETTPPPPRKLSAFEKILFTPSRVSSFIEGIIDKRRSDLKSKGKKATGQSNPVSIIDYAELGPGALDELIARGKTAKGMSQGPLVTDFCVEKY